MIATLLTILGIYLIGVWLTFFLIGVFDGYTYPISKTPRNASFADIEWIMALFWPVTLVVVPLVLMGDRISDAVSDPDAYPITAGVISWLGVAWKWVTLPFNSMKLGLMVGNRIDEWNRKKQLGKKGSEE